MTAPKRRVPATASLKSQAAQNVPGAWEPLVDQVVQATPVTDIHTHLYDPAMG